MSVRESSYSEASSEQREQRVKRIDRDIRCGEAPLAVGVFDPVLERPCVTRRPERPAHILALGAAHADSARLVRGAGALCVGLRLVGPRHVGVVPYYAIVVVDPVTPKGTSR